MPFAPDDFLALQQDPLQAIAQAARRSAGGAAAGLPSVSPDQQDSILGSLLEEGIGGLGYLGKIADKTFGGRAVRGALGGNPNELLSVLPLSDTLGITNEKDTVTGQDLLAKAGLITPGDDSFANQALGFGAELALDPSTYLGFGPVTKAGALAEKAGALPKTLAGRLKGFDTLESAITPTLQAGQRVSDVTPAGARVLPAALEQRAAQDGVNLTTGTPLASLVGVGLPFQEPLLHFGTGPTAQRIAGGIDFLNNAALSSAPVRAVRAVFDPTVGGAYNRGVQQLNEDVLRPLGRDYLRQGTDRYVDLLQQADPLVAKNPQLAADTARMAAEGFGTEALGRATAGAPGAAADAYKFTPDEAGHLVRIGTEMGDSVRTFGQMEKDLGLGTSELLDAFADYFTRSKNPVPRKEGESVGAYFNRLAQDFSSTHGSQITRDSMFRDVPGGTVQINDWAKDPALKALPDLERQAYLRQQLVGSTTPPPDSPAWKQAKNLSQWIEGLAPDYSVKGIDFFRTDPFADFLLRARRSAKARSSAETVFEGVKRFAEQIPALEARGAGYVPIEDLLQQLRLTGEATPGTPAAAKIAADRLGLADLNDLKGYALPADVARDVRKLGAAWQMPQELNPILQAWDYVGNLFKTFVTAPFAAFHARNVMSGLFNMWRDDSLSMRALGEAYNVVRGGNLSAPLRGMTGSAEDWTKQLVREAVSNRVAFTRDSGRAADTTVNAGQGLVARAPVAGQTSGSLLGDLGQWLANMVPAKGQVREGLNPFNIEGVNRVNDTNTIVRGLRQAQGKLDDTMQLAHYIAKRIDGFDPAQAAAAVKRYHLDYGDLTPFEKNVMKRIFPWYSFSRRSLPPILEDLATKPAKLSAAIRLTTGTREPYKFVPGYIGEGAAIPIPGAPDDQQRYISSFGLPFEDESVKALGSLLHGDVTRTLQQAIGMSMPQIKAPLEKAFGVQLFSGRPLDTLRPLGLLDQPNLFNEEQSRLASQIVSNTPLARFFTTIDKLTDERKGTLPTAINTLLGVKLTDVDQAQQRDIAARKLLEELLRGRSGVRVDESIYVPKDKIGQLDPQTAELYAVYRAAEKKAEQAKRERARQQLSLGLQLP